MFASKVIPKGKEVVKEEQFTRKLKTICVFGGSSFGKDAKLAGAAMDLGKELAARHIDVLYEGGSAGIRACVATAALIRGSKVGGITLKRVSESMIFGCTLGTELKTTNMHDRMAKMLYFADAFIAIPGGLGTLEAIFNIVSWGKLNIHQRPIGLLNTNGFFDGLLSFLDHVVDQGLINQATKDFLVSAPDPAQLIDQLQTFVPKPDPLLQQVKWCSSKKGESSKGGEPSKDDEPNTTLKL